MGGLTYWRPDRSRLYDGEKPKNERKEEKKRFWMSVQCNQPWKSSCPVTNQNDAADCTFAVPSPRDWDRKRERQGSSQAAHDRDRGQKVRHLGSWDTFPLAGVRGLLYLSSLGWSLHSRLQGGSEPWLLLLLASQRARGSLGRGPTSNKIRSKQVVLIDVSFLLSLLLFLIRSLNTYIIFSHLLYW